MLMVDIHNLRTLVLGTVYGWNRARVFLLGAALSFFAVISMPSILVIVIAVAGAFVGKQDVQDQLVARAHEAFGDSAATVVQSVADSASLSSLSNISTIIGIVVLLWVAGTVFSQLQSALNSIWDVEPPREGGIVLYVFRRLKAIGIVFALGVVALLSFIATAFVAALDQLFKEPPTDLGYLLQIAESVTSLLVITAILLFMYKVLPQVEIGFKDVLPGAVITAVLFTAGKYLISLYLAHSNLASVYGTASSLVLLLLWVYYSALIFFGGAVFTRVYHDLRQELTGG
jgi:membrane protein